MSKKCYRDGWKQRTRIVTRSVAFLMGLSISLVSVFPVYSQVAPDLHFEIRHNGKTIDPEYYLLKTRIVSL